MYETISTCVYKYAHMFMQRYEENCRTPSLLPYDYSLDSRFLFEPEAHGYSGNLETGTPQR